MAARLYVHLNDRGLLDFKPAGVKGARWHSDRDGLNRVVDEVEKAGILSAPFSIEFLDAKERAAL
jgi:hypothetical protein